MPQRNAPGGASKKKKGRAPKHQNTFAFRHNPKSKKTDKILNSPNVGVCRRCHEKIEWRKKYRKYKPRTQPGKCNLCGQKNIKAAYHTICTDCAGSDRAIEDMERKRGASSISAAVKDKVQTTSEMNETETAIKRARRRLRVCAMCAAVPALSKHSYGDGHDEDLIEEIHLLEDKIEDGVNDDGKKLTLREIKSLERKIEKLQMEMKDRRKNRENKEADNEDQNEDDDNNEDGSDGEEAERVQIGQIMEEQNDEDDPFLLAVGGKDKLLVGDDYQKMLLARGQQV